MLIADSQVHIWGANTPERPWPVKNSPHRSHHDWPSFTKDDLLRDMDAAGVNRVIIIPPGWEGERNDLALQAAQAHPDRFAVMGRLNPDAPGAREQMATWRRQPGMLGLRMAFTRQGNPVDWLWSEAQTAKVPIMMTIDPDKLLPVASDAAGRHPELQLVIDHCGIPTRTKDEAAFAHFNHLVMLAKYPNIAVKVSALPHFITDEYPFRRLHPYIRRVYDAFGPKRMFWGTDFTSPHMPCSYRQGVTMFTEEIPWLTDSDKEWIMGRGLCEWLDWKMPSSSPVQSPSSRSKG